jgi:methyl coenzyme M reductase beta subunit
MIRAFSLIAYCTALESASANNGLAVYGGPLAYTQRIADAIPSKFGESYTAKGTVAWNSAAASGGGTVAGWICKTAGWNAPDWVNSTAYKYNQLVNNDTGKIYVCTAEGTSAGSGGPTGTSTGITDGGVTWNYVGTPVAVWTALAAIT